MYKYICIDDVHHSIDHFYVLPLCPCEVSWLLALLREGLEGSLELLERLLQRPVAAFRPSVEQAMPVFQQLKGPSTGLLLLALESAAPKKATKHMRRYKSTYIYTYMFL